MSNEKRTGSAAQRREQERQQKQRSDAYTSLRNQKGPRKAPKMQKKDRDGLYLALGALVVVGTFIIGLVVYNNVRQSANNQNLQRVAADPAVVQMLTGVSQPTWEAVGTGGIKNPFTTNHGQPLLQGPNGHPQFFYVGGEYCPYCAAERWAMISALSRFGTFSHLSQIQSVEQNIPTFSFYKSSYSSPYVDFLPVEVNGNALDTSGQTYVGLETMTPTQQQTFNKYNSGQNFPFVDIGNQYVTVGSSYDQTLLLDGSSNPLSWQDIASSLSNPRSPISKAVLGTANYMTAAICNVTNQQPGTVCNSSLIQQLEHTLGQASPSTSTHAPASEPTSLIGEQRRALEAKNM